MILAAICRSPRWTEAILAAPTFPLKFHEKIGLLKALNNRDYFQNLFLVPAVQAISGGSTILHGNGLFIKQVEQSSDNRCVLWRTARELVFESSFKWHTFLFLMLFCSISPISQKFNSCVTDGRTDGRTDRRADRRTETPSYRDARTHLRRCLRPSVRPSVSVSGRMSVISI